MQRFIRILFFTFLTFQLSAQTEAQKIKVFLEGEVVDFSFVRRNITFVDFVTDQSVSDVFILITKQSTSSGGKHYRLLFSNNLTPTINDFTLNCITHSEDTDENIRIKFTKTLKSGLMPFLNEGLIQYSFSIETQNEHDTKGENTKFIIDKWNNWIFNIGLKGSFEAEEQKKQYAYETSFDANRITEMWRIRNGYDFQREESIITITEDSTSRNIKTFNQEQDFDSRIVYSISNKWSAGIFAELEQDTYKNTKSKFSIRPALEYNFFSWQEADRRVFTISYSIGPALSNYYEPTIFNKTSDYNWVESFKVDVEFVEKWGGLYISLEGGHHFPNFDFYYVETDCELSIRIAKGLFIEFGIAANKINNQLYLPGSELSDEDLLLNTRKLPTSFEIDGMLGIRYQFGSIYNSIVNDRL